MRVVAVSMGVVLVGLAGAASVAVAGQRPTRVVQEENANARPLIPEHAYFTATMDPIYKVAWPEACGFGSSEGEVFVQIGEGCSAEGGPHALIRTLEGVNPKIDPAGAFAAVQSACAAGRPVRIAFSRAGVAGVKTAACASLPAVPATPVRFTIEISYDPAISIGQGDRLEITLDRDLGTEGTASTGMEFDLAPGALPKQAFADLMPPLLPPLLRPDRSIPMFTMSARIIDRNGVIKAVSDRDLGRSHAPYLVRADAIWTKLQLVSMADPGTAAEEAAQTAREAARTAAAAARAALTPDQRARADAASTGEGFKAICSEKNAFEAGFCNGVMFGAALRNVGGAICLPAGIDYGVMAGRAQTVLATETVYPGEVATDVATRAIAKAYPCGSAPAAVAATTRGIPTGRLSPVPEAYNVEAEITEDAVTYAAQATASGQARLVLAGGRYRLTVDRSTVDTDRRRSDIRIYRREADGQETLVGSPSMVSARDATAQYRDGTEGGFMIDITVSPQSQ